MLINLSGYNSIGFECIEIYFMDTNFVGFVIINKSCKQFCYNKLSFNMLYQKKIKFNAFYNLKGGHW